MPLKRESPDDWNEWEKVIGDAIHCYNFLNKEKDGDKKSAVSLSELPLAKFIYEKLAGRQVLTENANEVSVRGAIAAVIAIHKKEVGTGKNAKLSVDISMTRRIYLLLCQLKVLQPAKHFNPDSMR